MAINIPAIRALQLMTARQTKAIVKPIENVRGVPVVGNAAWRPSHAETGMALW